MGWWQPDPISVGKQTSSSSPNPAAWVFKSGRLGSTAERHARDFEALLGKVERGEAVATGALTPQDPGEFDRLRGTNKGSFPCPSAFSDAELMQALQDNGRKE